VRRNLLASVLLLLCACAPATQGQDAINDVTPPSLEIASGTQLTVDVIDSSALRSGLGLIDRALGESGDGRMRVRWHLPASVGPANTPDRLEIIGNDQADADLVAWTCTSFDESGSFVRPTPTSRCGKFFRSVLANIVTNPDDLTSALLARADDTRGTAYWISGDFSVETDSQYYFIRRESRR
jgi:hypothetical protein